ncbi:MAG: adenylate/guanylate cyclase domain-containing protein, partial [Treponema sp.]|nr:adenylate/guanylate cyclase domain-containing protein [Treponema sp.]
MWKKYLFFTRIGKTRIIPIGFKILLIFICLILLSNFATNIISIQLSQKQIITLNNTIMVEQLKELYNNSANQFQIYSYSQKKDECLNTIGQIASTGFGNENSLAMGVKEDGTIEFFTCNNELIKWTNFSDAETLALLLSNYEEGTEEGSVSFTSPEGDFFGVYKYQPDWGFYLIRAEKRSDMQSNTLNIYLYTSILIVILTSIFIIIGYIILNKEFQTVRKVTAELLRMQKNKQLSL